MFSTYLKLAWGFVSRWFGKAAGAFSGVRILWIVIPLLAGATSGGFWAGNKWSDGGHAITNLERLEESIDRYQRTVEKAYGAALEFEQAKVIIEEFYDHQDQEFRNYVQANRERLDGCDIGADGLRIWNQWNAGPGSGNTTEPDSGVP